MPAQEPDGGGRVGVDEQAVDPAGPDAVRGAVAVHEHDPAHRGGLQPGEVGDDRGAARVPHEHRDGAVGRRQVQRREEGPKLLRVARQGVRPAPLGVPETTDVDGVDPVALRRQPRAGQVPHPRGLEEAVHEHDRRPGRAPLLVVGHEIARADVVAVGVERRPGQGFTRGDVVAEGGERDDDPEHATTAATARSTRRHRGARRPHRPRRPGRRGRLGRRPGLPLARARPAHR